MGLTETGQVASNSSRIIVVRAWRNLGQLVVRILAAPVDSTPPREWAFSDADSACEKIAEILHELDTWMTG
ncbi:hypothetical protein [Mycobacterium sp. 050134]|uniref:hypothetical protein n=1 Tax=Mycobacterium sp. 050134 TaxID=3096111 RepID=UPI002ED97346